MAISLDEWTKERNRRFNDAKRRTITGLIDCYIDQNGEMKVPHTSFEALVDLLEAICGTFDWEKNSAVE